MITTITKKNDTTISKYSCLFLTKCHRNTTWALRARFCKKFWGWVTHVLKCFISKYWILFIDLHWIAQNCFYVKLKYSRCLHCSLIPMQVKIIIIITTTYMNTRKLNARSEISFLDQKVDSYFDDQGPSLIILILCAEFTHSYDNCSKPKDTEW